MSRVVACVVLCAVLGACDGSLTTDAADKPAGPPPLFQPVACGQRDMPPGRQVTCGLVEVPLFHEQPNSGRVALRVAILKATTAEPASDPVLLLEDGPGGSGIATGVYYAGWAIGTPLSALLARRDVILVDQRGTGASNAPPACPEVAVRALAEGTEESGEFSGTAVRACAQRFATAGFGPARFGTDVFADDTDAVRRALGLARWNVVGIGYGARLALELLRRHPAPLRAAVLDSPVPPDVDAVAEQGPNLARSLEVLYGACNRQRICSTAYPDLANTLHAVFSSLEAEPMEVATHGASVRLDGQAFVEAVSSMLRDAASLTYLPRRLAEAGQGNLDPFAAELGAPRGQPSMGVHLSVICAERMAHTSREQIEQRAAPLPAPIRGALTSRFYAAACPLWNAPAAPPTLRQPVDSTRPVLVLAGRLNPVASVDWARTAAATLRNGHLLELGRESHAVTLNPCGAAIAAAFLDDPTGVPDAGGCGGGEDPQLRAGPR